MPNEEVLNRLKQGAAAAAGTAAIMVLSSLRAIAAREGEVNVKGLALVTAVVSVVAGVLWATMPRAKDDITETFEAVREEVEPTAKTVANVAMQQELGNIPPQYGQHVPGYSTSTYSTKDSTTTSRGYESIFTRTGQKRNFTDDDFDDEESDGWRRTSDVPWRT